jgi:Domain of unknown function (DUF3854)/D5 N terminal like
MVTHNSNLGQNNGRHPQSVNFFVDPEGRLYDSANNYFAQIENATDIKLGGRKPARLYHENKGYLGQGDQWVKDKDQAKLFTSKKELMAFLNLYFQSDNDSQSSLLDQITDSNEGNSDVTNSQEITTIVVASPELENTLIPKLFLVTLIASYRPFERLFSYREKVIKEFETSGIPSDVTDCCTDIFTPDNSQELKQRFIGKILKNDGSLDDKYKSFEVYNSGAWVALNSKKREKNEAFSSENQFTCAKLFVPREKSDNTTHKIEKVKYEMPLGLKPQKNVDYYLLPNFVDHDVLSALKEGIISEHNLSLDSKDYFTFCAYADFFNLLKEINNVSVNISEGFKKAVSLIYHKQLAVSFTSIYTWGYSDNDGNPVRDSEGFRMLNPEIKSLLKGSNEIILNFDMDTKIKTQKDVTDQCNQFAVACHRELGITVKRRLWENKLGKGIDDLLANGYTLEKNTQIVDLDIEKLTLEIKENNEIKRQKEIAYQEKMNKQNKKIEIKKKIESGNTSDLIVTYIDEVYRDLFTGHWIVVNENWYQFNGKYYAEVESKLIRQKILNYLDNYVTFDKENNPKKPHANNQSLNGAFNWIKTKLHKSINDINPDGYLPLDNGILLVTENNGKVEIKLEPHSPDKYFTYCSEVKYDPNIDCTHAYRLLECLDEPYKTLFIQSLSTILNFSLIRKKRDRIKALILEGDGSNGKDTLRTVTSLILGKKGMTGCNFNDFRIADNGRAFNLKRLVRFVLSEMRNL